MDVANAQSIKRVWHLLLFLPGSLSTNLLCNMKGAHLRSGNPQFRSPPDSNSASVFPQSLTGPYFETCAALALSLSPDLLIYLGLLCLSLVVRSLSKMR